ncbi:MAG: hypothetical protein QXP01_08740 [Candidatus Hadarchaeum sp.]
MERDLGGSLTLPTNTPGQLRVGKGLLFTRRHAGRMHSASPNGQVIVSDVDALPLELGLLVR